MLDECIAISLPRLRLELLRHHYHYHSTVSSLFTTLLTAPHWLVGEV